MSKNLLIVSLVSYCFLFSAGVAAQHTFSIVAFDPETGEVGSAGATCLDSVITGGFDAYGINGIIPGTGAINAQALLQPQNLENGLAQMANGLNAQELIDWLVANDVGGSPEDRQYGIVAFDGIDVTAAGYTGEEAFDYKDHIVGPNYAIQGNILIGPQVLEQMEANFLNCSGSLADKLMLALQGAKIPGADARCLSEGISAQSAFIRMAKFDDAPDNLSLDLRVASRPFGMDPIDSLQTRFDAWKAVNDPNQDDLGAVALTDPASGEGLGMENLTISVRNFGTSIQDTFDVGYSVNGEAPIVETVTTGIAPGATLTHTFATTSDLSAFGDYTIKVFANVGADELNCNDTTEVVVSHYARTNAVISDLFGLENGACGDAFPVLFLLGNAGLDTLRSANISVMINDKMADNYVWEGALGLQQAILLSVDLPTSPDGTNDITLICSEPNGQTDQVPDNNTVTASFEYDSNNDYVLFELFTDTYPDETTWDIRDDNVQEVASGGPYFRQFGLFRENLCLPTNSCYLFTIFDAYGDGICCSYGEGYYRLSDEEGNVLIEGGQFGFVDTATFCLITTSLRTLDDFSSISVTPNPFSDHFECTIDSEQPMEDLVLQLYSTTGTLVHEAQHSAAGSNFKEVISTTDLAQGTYLLKVTSGQRSEVVSVVKM